MNFETNPPRLRRVCWHQSSILAPPSTSPCPSPSLTSRSPALLSVTSNPQLTPPISLHTRRRLPRACCLHHLLGWLRQPANWFFHFYWPLQSILPKLLRMIFHDSHQIVFSLLFELFKQNPHPWLQPARSCPVGPLLPSPATFHNPQDPLWPSWATLAFALFLDHKSICPPPLQCCDSCFSTAFFAWLTLLSFSVSSNITSPERTHVTHLSKTRSPMLPSVHYLNPSARLLVEALNTVVQ